jgi:hypothetical protein
LAKSGSGVASPIVAAAVSYNSGCTLFEPENPKMPRLLGSRRKKIELTRERQVSASAKTTNLS